MVALYFGGILMGILMALLLRGTMFKGEAVPFVMELPNYRMPGAKNVGQLLWEKAKDFLQRAFTVIFFATIIIWFLQTFNLHMNVVADSRDSILAVVAGIIAPVFLPLGFGNWKISTALITGFMAKESVVSTLSVLFGSTAELTGAITPVAAASLWSSACCIHHVLRLLHRSRENLAQNGRHMWCWDNVWLRGSQHLSCI